LLVSTSSRCEELSQQTLNLSQLISKLQTTIRRFISSFAPLREKDFTQRRKGAKEDEK
jgi:hypothetical protein